MPLLLFTGVTVKAVPLHADAEIGLIAGFGFTVTVTVKFDPVQLGPIGLTV